MKATVPFDLININPLRDLNINPLNDEKVQKLATSIKDLTWWDNLVARPAANCINGDEELTPESLEAYLAERDYVVDFPVEIPYGAHRHKAIELHNSNPVKNVPIEFLEMSINLIPDDLMLAIMVEENSSEWKHSTSTMVESVKQVYRKITEQIQEFTEEEFEAYKETYGYVKQEPEFKKIIRGTKEIGPTPIQSFLGGRMPEEDLRGSIAAIKLADKGYVDIEDLYVIGSGSSLRWVCDLVLTIHSSKEIPQLMKDNWTDEILALFSDKVTKLPSVKALKAAKSHFLKGNDPFKYLNNNITSAFSVVQYISRLLLDGEIFNIEEATKKLKGLEGYEEELVAALENAIKIKERKEQKDKDPVDPTEPIDPVEPGGGVDPEGVYPTEPEGGVEEPAQRPLAKGEIGLSVNTIVAQSSVVIEHLNILLRHSTEVPKDHPDLYSNLALVMDRACFLIEDVLGTEVISDTLEKLSQSYGEESKIEPKGIENE